MKTPRPKIHLLDVSEPLLSYFGLVCRCGITLKNAQPKFMWTEDIAKELNVPLPGVCRDCQHLRPADEDKRTYVYGLVEAQEEKDSLEAA